MKRPLCFQNKEFSDCSEICLFHCKYRDDCIEESGFDLSNFLKKRIKNNSSKLKLPDMIKILKNKKTKKKKDFIPDVEIKKMPKVDKKVQERMDFYNK